MMQIDMSRGMRLAAALAGVLVLGLAAQAENLVPEGKRDFEVPFKGAGQMGLVYVPVFLPKGAGGVVVSGEEIGRAHV